MLSVRRSAFAASPGFAALSVILIVALVMIAIGSFLTIASNSSSLIRSDEDGARALGAGELGVSRAIDRLRWGWPIVDVYVAGRAADGAEYSVVATEIPPEATQDPSAAPSAGLLPSSCTHTYRVCSAGASGRGRRRVVATVVVTPDALPRGVVVGGDLVVSAELRVLGCGVYAGGSVAGRENITLGPPGVEIGLPASPLPDLAYGGVYAVATVHAGGVITAGGEEVHGPGVEGFESDDDSHTGGGPSNRIVECPTWLTITALASHAADPGVGLVGSTLDLELVPAPVAAADSTAAPGSGAIIVLDRRESSVPLTIIGDRSRIAGALPLTIVVMGDCRLGESENAEDLCRFDGALVVTGRTVVSGPAQICGSVFAGSLDCRSSLVVDATPLGDTGRQEFAPGSSNVAVTSWQE